MAKSPSLRVVRSRTTTKGVSTARSRPDPDRRFTVAGAPAALEAATPDPGLLQGEDGRSLLVGRKRSGLCRYHDEEWGVRSRNDRRLFEKICLEGFQSGLSWLTILRKRENFREAFEGFDPERVARFSARDVARLLKNAGIVRHRGKIESTINNAGRALDLIERAWVARGILLGMGAPARSAQPCSTRAAREEATTPASVRLAKELKPGAGPSSGRPRSTPSCRRWAS